MKQTHGGKTVFEAQQILCGRFRIERFVARGGMGEVYAAEDLELGVEIALKTIRTEIAEDELTLKRFKREIKLARTVTHPNVCRIFDLFTHREAEGDRGQLFLTMELVPGETLRRYLLRHGKIAAAEALPLARQLVSALASAHGAGVVHRDLKSDNIFLVPAEKGGTPRVVVADFGLARSPSPVPTEDSLATAEGRWVGTPAYVSPEQLQGLPADKASDIYSLGIVLFEMITGERPFDGPNPMSAAVRRLVEEPRSPSSLLDQLDPRWEAAIMGCLERDPRRRFADAEDILHTLEGAPVQRQTRRFLVAGSVTAVLLGLALIAGIALRPRPTAAADRPSVAVLGFANLGGQDQASWLGTALTQMMASELAAGEELCLIPAEDVARARLELELPLGQSLSHDTLERVRGVVGNDLVVTGTYIALENDGGNQLRLDLQVQETASGEVVASVSRQSGERELFTLVAAAGHEIRQRLGVSRRPNDSGQEIRQALPSSPRAARLYAEGLEALWALDTQHARRLLEQAVGLEPEFPQAHAALARAWAELGNGRKASVAALRAFEHSSGLAREQRLLIEAQYRESSHEWPQAIDLYRSLWTFFPENPIYGLRLAEAQLASGAPAEATATLEAIALHPLSIATPQHDILRAEVAMASSRYDEALDWSSRAADQARALGARLALARARLLRGKAQWRQGDSNRARTSFDEALQLFREAGDRHGEANVLLALGEAQRDSGKLEEAHEHGRMALALAEELGDVMGIGTAHGLLGDVELLRGELDTALSSLEAALAAFVEAGDSRQQARVLKQRAIIARRRGDLEGALDGYTRSHEALADCGDQSGAAAALVSMAVVERQLGNLSSAVQSLEEAIEIRRTLGHRRQLAVPLVNLANVELELGSLESARSHYAEALEYAREVGSPRHQSYALFGLGEVAFARGDPVHASSLHNQALQLRREIGEQGAVLASLLAIALVQIDMDATDEARLSLEEAQQVLNRNPAPDLESWLWAVRARAALAERDPEKARDATTRAEALLEGSADLSARVFVQITAARVQLLSHRPQRALKIMDWVLAQPLASLALSTRIEAQLIAGECALAAGNESRAEQHLRTARSLARESGHHRLEERAEALLNQSAEGR